MYFLPLSQKTETKQKGAQMKYKRLFRLKKFMTSEVSLPWLFL